MYTSLTSLPSYLGFAWPFLINEGKASSKPRDRPISPALLISLRNPWDKREGVIVATTDPATLPNLTTFYLITNLPAPGSQRAQDSELGVASVEEVGRLYGLRMWVEQSYKQVKHALGWSEYQVRSDQAIRRHWQLVCCAFCFCWYYQAHPLRQSR